MCFRYLYISVSIYSHGLREYCWGGGIERAYRLPFIHCASSTISKLEWIMNWFMYCAVSGNRKRAIPSPPLFEVPKAMLKRGASVGERIVK